VLRIALLIALTAGLAACNNETRDEPGDVGGDTATDTGGGDTSTDTGETDSGGGDTGGPDTGLPEPERHRPTAEVCDRERDDTPVETFGMEGDCETHADCTEGENGRCTNLGRWIACTYDDCFEDSDCGDTACICDGGSGASNACMGGNCQTDADCGPGGWCSPSYGECGDYSGVVAYYCHTPEDECVNDSDCGGPGSYCWFDPTVAHWACSNSHCAG